MASRQAGPRSHAFHERICDRFALALREHGLHERRCLKPDFPALGGPVIRCWAA